MTVEEYGIPNYFENENNITLNINHETFSFLMLYAPKSKSDCHYSRSKEYFGLNNKNVNAFLNDIIKGLNIFGNCFPFATMVPTKLENKTDLSIWKNKKHYLLFLTKTEDGASIICNFFDGLRDALAHGNIYQTKDSFILFSCKKPKNVNLKPPLKFVLSIDKLERLDCIKKILEEYKSKKKSKI